MDDTISYGEASKHVREAWGDMDSALFLRMSSTDENESSGLIVYVKKEEYELEDAEKLLVTFSDLDMGDMSSDSHFRVRYTGRPGGCVVFHNEDSVDEVLSKDEDADIVRMYEYRPENDLGNVLYGLEEKNARLVVLEHGKYVLKRVV